MKTIQTGTRHQNFSSLSKVLGRLDILSLSFGAMIGWGWVVLTGEMIVLAGTLGAALAFACGSVMVILIGLLYAELTSALPRAGGELTFTYVGIGPTGSYACSWMLVLAYMTVVAFEVVSLPTVIGYLTNGLSHGYLYSIAGSKIYLSWVAVGFLGTIGIGIINFFGVRMSSFVQGVAAATLLLIGLSFFVPGNIFGDLSNLEPKFTTSEGFLRVLIMTPFFFLGFDVIPQISEEIALPFRTVGRFVLLAIICAASWYILVMWTVGLTLDETARINSELVTADAMAHLYSQSWGTRALIFGGLLGILTSWKAFFLGASRLLYAMARGGMLPPVFARLHPRYKSPVAVILLLTSLSLSAPFFGRQVLVWLVNSGGLATVLSYFFVTVSFIRIRKLYPNLKRPYRVFSPHVIGPLATTATIIFICLYLPGSPSALVWPQEWAIILLWIVLGIFLFSIARKQNTTFNNPNQRIQILGEYADKL